MKPLLFIIFGVYILLYVLAGFIFGAMPVMKALVVMFILATIIYIWILVEEKPWKFAFVGENLVAYALMAYVYQKEDIMLEVYKDCLEYVWKLR